MATARLTAYGATAKGSGYADTDTACSTNTGGTQLLASDDAAVFVYAEDSDENTRVYLAKVASVSTPAHLYIQSDGYANGQKIYIPEQTIGGIFGAITTAGYYTVTIDGDFVTAAYITAFGATESFAQPTACPEADPFPNKESTPTGDEFSTTFVDNQMSQLTTQYERGTGLESFVPARMTVRGPSNLRSRPQSLVYKVTKG